MVYLKQEAVEINHDKYDHYYSVLPFANFSLLFSSPNGGDACSIIVEGF